jgi:hypothetical protein
MTADEVVDALLGTWSNARLNRYAGVWPEKDLIDGRMCLDLAPGVWFLDLFGPDDVQHGARAFATPVPVRLSARNRDGQLEQIAAMTEHGGVQQTVRAVGPFAMGADGDLHLRLAVAITGSAPSITLTAHAALIKASAVLAAALPRAGELDAEVFLRQQADNGFEQAQAAMRRAFRFMHTTILV